MIKFYSLIFTLLATVSMAQTYQVKGFLHDKNTEETLAAATIILTDVRDTTKRFYAISGIEGDFTIKKVNSGSYHITISYLGYIPYRQELTVTTSDVDLGRIRLNESEKLLDEVTIQGQVPAAVQKGDTLQFNADAYKTNPDANAEDLIEKMPGVVVENGKVQAQGEDVRRVLVDGREFFGNDPNAALKNIPADVIQKIEIFDQQSDQSQFTGFDDGNTNKTINIVTRPEFRNGNFGRAFGGYGTDDRYSAGIVFNDFNENRRLTVLGLSNNVNEQNFTSEDLAGVMGASGRRGRRGGAARGGRGGGGRSDGPGGMGSNVSDFMVAQQQGITKTNSLGLNYSDEWGEKIDVTGSYFFNRTANQVGTNLFREYILPADSGLTYHENEEALSTNLNHRFNLRLKYDINEKSSILYRPSVTVQLNDGSSMLTGETREKDLLLNGMENLFNSDLIALKISNHLLFRHRFNKPGRTLTFNMSQDHNTTGGNSSLQALNFSDGETTDTLDQIADLDQYRNSLSANVIYTERLGESGMLNLNYRASRSFNDSDQRTYNWMESSESYDTPDSLLSNSFTSDFVTHQAGAGVMFRKEKLTLNARLSYQYAQLNSDQYFPEDFRISRDFNNILPMLNLRYRISNRKNLMLSYRTSTDEPSVNQLQEVLDNSNPLRLFIGNSSLQQEYQHQLFLRFSAPNPDKSTVFFALLSASVTNDYIGRQVFFANHKRKVGDLIIPAGAQLSRPLNLEGNFNIRSFTTYGVPLAFVKSNLNLNLTASYSRTPGMINDRLNYSYSPSAGAGATLSSNISDKLDFTFTGNSSYNYVTYSLESQRDDSYLNNMLRGKLYWDIWKGIVFTSNLAYHWYMGLSDTFNQEYFLLNLSVGKRILNEKGEIRLSAYDLLKQNTSISRDVTAAYIQDSQKDILQRYLLLTFKYNIRNFQ